MKQKFFRAAAASLALLMLLSLYACAPEFVGETKAKQAGLTLLRQAFGVSTDIAHVEYFERAGTSVIDNSDIPADDRTPDQIYLVTISDQTLGIDLYYAEVDAKTGVAYYASKSEWVKTPQSTNPPKQTTEYNGEPAEVDAVDIGDGAITDAGDFSMRCLKKEVTLVSARGCCRRDSVFSPRVGIGYFMTFADGALYRFGISWPALQGSKSERLGNDGKGQNP